LSIRLVSTQIDKNERRKKYGSAADAAPGEQTWFTIDDVRRLKEAGANCLELHAIRVGELMPERNVIDEAYFTDWLDKWVSWCESYGLYYIINIRGFRGRDDYERVPPTFPDWLWKDLGYSAPTTQELADIIIRDFFDVDVTRQDVNREAWINAWKFIAERYKNNTYALFGLMNEPLAGVTGLTSSSAVHLGESYSQFMEAAIDGVRSMGAKQSIFVDRPYVWYVSNVQPVNRDNIVWEDHLYVGEGFDIASWKNAMDAKVQRFVYDFGKPLFIGEYGIDPYSLVKEEPLKSTWKDILAEQTAFLDSKPVVGKQWHQWGALEGEYYDFVYDWFTAEDSQYIVDTVFKLPPELPKLPFHDDFLDLDKWTVLSGAWGIK